MFGPSEDSLSASHFKDWTKAMPSDDEVMQEVVFRLNELSVKDVSQPQKPILTTADLPHAPPKPLGKNFKSNVKECEKFRSPASVRDLEEGEAIAICRQRVENRTPAVNYPVELLKLSSKPDAIERVKSLCQENAKSQPKRRKGNFRPEKRSDKLVEERKVVEDYELGDKNPRRHSKNTRSLRSSSESSNQSPKRKPEEELSLESPKRARVSPKKASPKKKKLQTARKSTTPHKESKKNPPPVLEPIPENVEEPNLDETIIELSSDEEPGEAGAPVCVGKINDDQNDFEDEPVDPFDPIARDIKRELISDSEAKKSPNASNTPESPINED